jgi:hypothetical protein
LTGTSTAHIPCIFNINIPTVQADAITQLMQSISEIPTEWISSCRTQLCNIVLLVVFSTFTSIPARLRPTWFNSTFHLSGCPQCINTGPLDFINVDGGTTISRIFRMLSKVTKMPIFRLRRSGLISIVFSTSCIRFLIYRHVFIS